MRKNLLWMTLLLVGVLALGACVAPAPTVDTPGEPAPATGPKTLTIAAGTDVENLDIHRVTASPSFSVLEHIYETLFYMNTEGELEPLLAESLEPGD
ncbi:MAG: hypothetical protein R6W76_08700, partial [Caldilinea sp.]